MLNDAITDLLAGWNAEDGSSREALASLLYDELRSIAAVALANEKPGHVLQPTALVNEAFLKLVNTDRITWQNRGHFLAVATTIMRQLLVDEARKRNSAKRDWGRQVTFTGNLAETPGPNFDLLVLDESMTRLRLLRPELCQLVDLRFFGGLTLAECATATGVSRATINRQWRTARAWLTKDLAGEILD